MIRHGQVSNDKGLGVKRYRLKNGNGRFSTIGGSWPPSSCMEITTTTSYPLDGKAGTTGPRCGALESVSKSGEAGFGVLYGTDERPEEWALRLRRWKPKPLINRSATGFETASKLDFADFTPRSIARR